MHDDAKEKEKCLSFFLEKNKNILQGCNTPDASTTASIHLWLCQNLLINT